MRTADFNYKLPVELIAQKPFFPRDQCRLMIVKRDSGKRTHGRFFDLIDYLKPGDVLVLNDSKVFKARLFGLVKSPLHPPLSKGDRGGFVEIFLLKIISGGIWEVLVKPGKKLTIGTRVWFSKKPLTLFLGSTVWRHRLARLGGEEPSSWLLAPPRPLSPRGRGKVRGIVWADVVGQTGGKYHIKFNIKGKVFWKFLEKYGHVPVPPYVKEEPKKLADYQTVYANQLGSVAAPTAGFHFTKNFLNKLQKKGIEICYLTLHIGYGTFKPIKCERIEEHEMESEWVEISRVTAEAIKRAKAEGRRVVAVGTTVVRALEGMVENPSPPPLIREGKPLLSSPYQGRNFSGSPPDKGELEGVLKDFFGEVNLFITPGFKFKIIDALVTNFHLPQSTLLLLVSAFAGRDLIRKAYAEAIRQKYRFYSFGDAMLII